MAGGFSPDLQPYEYPSKLRKLEPREQRSSSLSQGAIGSAERPLDLTQRIEKKLAECKASNNIYKRWLLELACWTTSALCMGAVVGIYLSINGKVVASAALIVPTSEALGQLKWNWFNNSKAIWDFEIFDKASRGPWGAALLLYRTKGRSLAALGALLIVLLLAIDTFVQQVVNIRFLAQQANMHGLLMRRSLFVANWFAKWYGPAEVPFSNGTICGHFINATTERPILLTGYVANETEDSSPTGEILLVRLVPLTDFDTKAPEYGAGSIRFKDVRQPILDALIATTPNGTDSIFKRTALIVEECLLTWCVQTVKSTYEWGTYREDVISRYFETSEYGVPWPWYTYPSLIGTQYIYNESVLLTPPRLGGNKSDSTLFSPAYSMSNVSAANVLNLFDDIFPSFYTAASATTEPSLRYFNYGKPLTRKIFFKPWQAPMNQSEHFEQIAKTITNVVRSSHDTIKIPGDAYSRKTSSRLLGHGSSSPFRYCFSVSPS